MPLTLAQRRALAEHARGREPSPSASDGAAPGRGDEAAAAEVSCRPAPIRSSTDPAAAWSGPAGRAVLTLVRSGARVVEVGPGRVRLRRDGAECEVDPRGRVAWRSR